MCIVGGGCIVVVINAIIPDFRHVFQHHVGALMVGKGECQQDIAVINAEVGLYCLVGITIQVRIVSQLR